MLSNEDILQHVLVDARAVNHILKNLQAMHQHIVQLRSDTERNARMLEMLYERYWHVAPKRILVKNMNQQQGGNNAQASSQ